ncbi:hypothetical protein MBLNU13_g10437t2 [Cladosporium sp. NU13]
MFTSIFTLAALVASAYAGGCHTGNTNVGKYCAFNPDSDAYLDAANAYCYQFRAGITLEKGEYVYQTRLVNAPDGFGGHQTFWGNYVVMKGDDVHLVTYDECMGYMKDILHQCPGGQ